MMGLWIVPVLLVSLGLTVALEEGFGIYCWFYWLIC